MSQNARENTASLSPKDYALDPYNSSNLVAIAFIAMAWISMVLLVGPAGDFPLNDDWAYSLSVKKLLEGEIWLHDWGASNLVSQLFWGAIFCKIFGFSYTSLRISTLVLGLAGGLLFFGLLRGLKFSSKVSSLAAISVIANPVYFASSNTFMTDVPFFAFCLASFWALLHAAEYKSWQSIAAGTALSMIGVLSRQIELAVPIAFYLTFMFGRRITLKNITMASIPLIMSAIVYIGFKKWLIMTGKVPFNYGLQIDMIADALKRPPMEIVKTIRGNAIKSTSFISFFASPVIFYCFTKHGFLSRKNIVIVGTISILSWFYVFPHTFPETGNILTPHGIGPSNFSIFLPKYVQKAWRYVAMLSTISFSMLFFMFFWYVGTFKRIVQENRISELRLPAFILLTILGYMAPVVALPIFYDRYLLIPLALTILLLLICTHTHAGNHESNEKIGYAPTTLVSIILIISTFMVHDYLSWSKVKWNGLTELIENGIPASKIDGKFEFNGTHLYKNGGMYNKNGPWVIDNEYTFVLSREDGRAPDGYKIISRQPISTILPMSPTVFYIVRRM